MIACAAVVAATGAAPVRSQAPPTGPQTGVAPPASTAPAAPLVPSRRDRGAAGGLQPQLDHDSRELGPVDREITVAPNSRGIRLPPGLPPGDPSPSPR